MELFGIILGRMATGAIRVYNILDCGIYELNNMSVNMVHMHGNRILTYSNSAVNRRIVSKVKQEALKHRHSNEQVYLCGTQVKYSSLIALQLNNNIGTRRCCVVDSDENTITIINDKLAVETFSKSNVVRLSTKDVIADHEGDLRKYSISYVDNISKRRFYNINDNTTDHIEMILNHYMKVINLITDIAKLNLIKEYDRSCNIGYIAGIRNSLLGELNTALCAGEGSPINQDTINFGLAMLM